jgi:amino acid transporter
MSRRKHVSAVTAPQPAITVATAIVLAALALVTTVVLFVTATAAVTVPIAVVLALGAMATTALMARGRRRRHERRASNRPTVRRATDEPPALPGWDVLGVLSTAILVMAFLVPPTLGPGLLAVGFAGLFLSRIAVMYRDDPAGARADMGDRPFP